MALILSKKFSQFYVLSSSKLNISMFNISMGYSPTSFAISGILNEADSLLSHRGSSCILNQVFLSLLKIRSQIYLELHRITSPPPNSLCKSNHLQHLQFYLESYLQQLSNTNLAMFSIATAFPASVPC